MSNPSPYLTAIASGIDPTEAQARAYCEDFGMPRRRGTWRNLAAVVLTETRHGLSAVHENTPADDTRAASATVTVPAAWLESGLFARKIKAANRRAVKLGCPGIRVDVQPAGTAVDQWGRAVPMSRVTLTGEAPTIPGYRFVGVIEPARDDVSSGNIVSSFDDLPGFAAKYRDVPLSCDHCNTVRRRNKTYVVRRDEDGRELKVGSSCLKDFTGWNHSGQSLAGYLESFAEFRRLAGRSIWNSGESYGRGDGYYPIDLFMDVAASAVRQYGFVGRKAAQRTGKTSTAALVGHWLSSGRRQLEARGVDLTPTIDDEELAAVVRDWVLDGTGLDLSVNFNANLRTAVLSANSDGYFAGRVAAFVAAAFYAFDRAMNPPAVESRPDVTATHNTATDWLSIRFNDKPAEETRRRLKSAGFRFRRSGYWKARRNASRYELAESLAGTVESVHVLSKRQRRAAGGY